MREPMQQPDRVIVAISGSPGSQQLIAAGRQLARALGASWEALFIETPETTAGAGAGGTVAEALALAAKAGATIATVPAASVIDGMDAHLQNTRATHLIVGRPGEAAWTRLGRQALADKIAARHPDLAVHIYPTQGRAGTLVPAALQPRVNGSLRHLGYAAMLVAATLGVSELLQLFISPRSLDLLFLLPVIAVAARLGLVPAIFAAALSVLCYNYFLLSPAFTFNPRAPQNVVMAGVLTAVAIYTSIITERMRGRALLSDRSARENASVAALGQRLTRDADWRASATTVCEHIHALLGVYTIMYREVAGELVQTAAVPLVASLGPVDLAARDAAWDSGEATGAGTEHVSTADWQFHPLKTSLGALALLGIARSDGRDPVRPDQRILLSTLIAQAALAHERLRLEDVMRETGLTRASPAEPRGTHPSTSA